jgi:hypothetical protein
MKLYKSKSKGQWVGTQRDAQKNFPRDWEEMNVPVSKQGLLEFLNHFKVGDIKQPEQPIVQVDPQQIDPEAYSWVRWAYETLRRGDKKEAEAMLLRGLEKQKEK